MFPAREGRLHFDPGSHNADDAAAIPPLQRANGHVHVACRLADGRQLERQDVMQLLRGCIQRPWPSANQHGSIWDDKTLSTSLQWLSTLEPGRHIIGDDVLELLELCEHVK